MLGWTTLDLEFITHGRAAAGLGQARWWPGGGGRGIGRDIGGGGGGGLLEGHLD